MSARQEVTVALRGLLTDPTYTVLDGTIGNDAKIASGRFALFVTRTTVQPSEAGDGYMSMLDVWLLTGHEDTTRADDALDAVLPDVIDAVEACKVTVRSAERGVYADLFHGYKIAIPWYNL